VILYRYFKGKYGLQALQEGRVRVSRLLDLNDPMDCRPTLVNTPARMSPAEQREVLQKSLGDFNDMAGMHCFSESIADPVIWSHYADRHQGMALGFEFPADFPVFPVSYPENENRPAVDFEELGKFNRPEETAELYDLVRRCFTVKAKSWKYEAEHRAFVYLHGKSCKIVGRDFFAPLPIHSLKLVILGAKSPISVSEVESSKTGWEYAQGVRVSRAVMDDNSFRLIT